MLKVKKLEKNYGGIKAVNNCSFEIKKNKITGLIGPNGAGKSTIFNLISGFEQQDIGNIYFNSKNISKKAPETISNLGISRVFQKSRLFDNLTVFENLRVSVEKENMNFFKSLFSSNKISKSEKKQIDDTMDLLNISHIKNKSCSELSFGQKRLVELARAILKPHSLLILDEPVAGVQPKIRNDIMDIIKVLKKKGETILLIEHDMFFTFKTCDEIVVLEKGKVIAKGPPKQIKNNKKVLDAYLGD